jgi:hypothetical protein
VSSAPASTKKQVPLFEPESESELEAERSLMTSTMVMDRLAQKCQRCKEENAECVGMGDKACVRCNVRCKHCSFSSESPFASHCNLS